MRLNPPSLPDAQYEAIVQIAADAIISVDASHRIVLFNRGAEAIFGYEAAEVMGMPLGVLLPEHVRGSHDHHLRAFAMSGVNSRLMSERRPVEGRRKSGELFPAEASISHVRMGNQSYLTAIVRDISERRQLEAERQALLEREREARVQAERARSRAAFLARVTETLDLSLDYEETLATLSELCVPELAAVCIIDVLEESGSIRRVATCHESVGGDDVARALMQYPRSGEHAFLTRAAIVEGRSVLMREMGDADLLRISEDDEHLALWRRVSPTSCICVPLAVSGRVLGAIGLVTGGGRRRFDADDQTLVAALAGRAALAVENARLFTQARRASALRDEALGVVSHDLRNPLATLSMALSRLEQERNAPPARAAELLDIGRKSIEWMHRLIGDLLDVASIDAGKLSVIPAVLDLSAVLRDAGAQFGEQCAERGIALAVELPHSLPAVNGDGGRLQQLMGNLLSNAIKFTPQGGQVTIAARSQHDEVVVSVVDSGPGIPRSDVPHVFDRFWHSRRGSRVRGTGLGLSIAKGIVEAHNGRIWVDTSEGAGSTFSFSLPVTALPSPAQPEPGRAVG